jgi:hypothetical protein
MDPQPTTGCTVRSQPDKQYVPDTSWVPAPHVHDSCL